ncbi:MAG: hypothetical protein H0T89_32060 [Deltaproteobacteria bacterium]|nr:hypothetical protein [Deltaproteobacteria bacterium]MDQ3299473.1 hypothetical protein [Myxococcota bacterium]
MGILGTGYDQFEAMPTELPLEYGPQAGFNLVANVQMRGLIPGNPDDIFEPSNPYSRISAYFADTGVPLRTSVCAFNLGYKPVDATTYEMTDGVPLIFDTCWRSGHLFGRQIRITLEIYDANRGYASDERVVTAVAPLNPDYPTEDDHPGCVP